MRDSIVSVIGGSGFLGRHVVRRLGKLGALVRVGCRHPNQGLFLKTMGEIGQIQVQFASIRDDTSIREIIRGSQIVINLGGIINESGQQSFPLIHAEGAARVARIAHDHGVENLIHISALGADPASESVYAKTKAAGEQEVRSAFPNAIIVRPALLFGPEDNFFTRFAHLAKVSPFIPLIEGGLTRFQPVYVSDVAEAIVNLAQESSSGNIYELGGNSIYTFRQLMEILLKTMGIKRIFLPIPKAVGYTLACLTNWMQNPPLTRDQIKLLRYDTILSGHFPGFKDLGITPASIEAILPTFIK